MKIFSMLIIAISFLFIIGCGDDDSSTPTGGMTEQEFYTATAVQLCEKAFECGVDLLTIGKTDASECKAEVSEATCSTSVTKYDASKAKACVDCAKALTCEQYFNGAMPNINTSCSACATVCVPK